MCNLCVVRVTLPRVDHGSAVSLGKNQITPSNSAGIKYLTIDPTKKWCVGKRCVSMCKISSHSPIFDTTNIHRSAVEIVLKIDDFCDATPPVFIGLQIRVRKVNLPTVVHVFCIHHFLLRKIFKYLIAHGIVAFHGRKMSDKCPKIPWQLRIWTLWFLPRETAEPWSTLGRVTLATHKLHTIYSPHN